MPLTKKNFLRTHFRLLGNGEGIYETQGETCTTGEKAWAKSNPADNTLFKSRSDQFYEKPSFLDLNVLHPESGAGGPSQARW